MRPGPHIKTQYPCVEHHRPRAEDIDGARLRQSAGEPECLAAFRIAREGLEQKRAVISDDCGTPVSGESLAHPADISAGIGDIVVDADIEASTGLHRQSEKFPVPMQAGNVAREDRNDPRIILCRFRDGIVPIEVEIEAIDLIDDRAKGCGKVSARLGMVAIPPTIGRFSSPERKEEKTFRQADHDANRRNTNIENFARQIKLTITS